MPLSAQRGRNLVDQVIGDDDGAHATELFELVNGTSDPDNTVGLEVKRYIYTFTEDFETCFRNYVESIDHGIEIDMSLPSS